LKSQNPNSTVTLKDLQTGERDGCGVTVVIALLRSKEAKAQLKASWEAWKSFAQMEGVR
jgi:hypothetical protein